MKYCSNCGSEVITGAKFCVHCGKRFTLSGAIDEAVAIHEVEEETGKTQAELSKTPGFSAEIERVKAENMEHPGGRIRNYIEYYAEVIIFGSRWLLAPVYLGLIVALVVIAIRFFQELVGFVASLGSSNANDMILEILGLLDLALLGNLVLIIIFAGYETFVSKINAADDSEDKPNWMGKVDFSGLKMKIIASLVALSMIELLKDFLNASSDSQLNMETELFRIGLHLTFVVSGLLFAIMDYIADKRVIMEEEADDNLGRKVSNDLD